MTSHGVFDVADQIVAKIIAAGGSCPIGGGSAETGVRRSKTSFGESAYIDASFRAGRRFVSAHIRVSDHDVGVFRSHDHMIVLVEGGEISFGQDRINALIAAGTSLLAA